MKQQDYKSIIVMVLGFLILGMVLKVPWLNYVAIGVGVAALISQHLLRLILKFWFGLAKVLGFINSRILLTVVYVVVLLPLAFLSRMFGNNSVQLKKKSGESYFVNRNHKYAKADLENPW